MWSRTSESRYRDLDLSCSGYWIFLILLEGYHLPFHGCSLSCSMEILHILSWDCAFKSLAWVYAEISIPQCVGIRVPDFKILSRGVADVIPDKKIKSQSTQQLIRGLHTFLNTIAPKIHDKTIVLIERQPQNVNKKSTCVSHILSYHYAMHKQIFVRPSMKNTLSFGSIFISDFINKYANTSDGKYRARKKHTTCLMFEYMNIFNDPTFTDGIAKKNYDDLADALIQIFVVLIYPLHPK